MAQTHDVGPDDQDDRKLWQQVSAIEAAGDAMTTIIADAEAELADLKQAFDRVRLELAVSSEADQKRTAA